MRNDVYKMKDYQYGYEWDSSYCYPNSFVLINQLGIKDTDALSLAEREITSVRYTQLIVNPVKGNFDLKHLQDIHRYLFQDIYSWAGKLRTVNIAKGNQFCNCMYLVSGSRPIFSKLQDTDRYLLGCDPKSISEKLAYYLGEINVIHPFREGNGRTQRVFIQYLAQAAGYSINFSDVSSQEMIEASAMAFECDYNKMVELFRRITKPISSQEQDQFIHSISTRNSPVLAAYEEITANQDMTLDEDECPEMKF